MKIQGPNPLINTYKQLQQQKQVSDKNPKLQADQLNISSEAKKMQESQQLETKRSERVEELKQMVEQDTYQVNHEQLAQKMVDFWSRGV